MKKKLYIIKCILLKYTMQMWYIYTIEYYSAI